MKDKWLILEQLVLDICGFGGKKILSSPSGFGTEVLGEIGLAMLDVDRISSGR